MYATPADMLARFGELLLAQLTDRGQSNSSQVDSGTLATALADAQALIDGYLLGRYATPIVPTPPQFVAMACNLARHALMVHTPDERARADFDAAVKYLTDVAKGSIALQPPAAQAPTPGAGSVLFTTGPKIFGRQAD